jgi:hypothetical protein
MKRLDKKSNSVCRDVSNQARRTSDIPISEGARRKVRYVVQR